jgi:hypothetical protein
MPLLFCKVPYVSLIGLFIVFWGVVSYRPVGRNCYFVETYFFLHLLWKWRQNIPPKLCYPPNIIWPHNPEERNTNLDFWEKHQIIEFHWASCTSVRCAWVDSELWHRLAWLRIFYCSSVAPDIYLDITSIVPWPLPSISLPIHRSLIIIPLHTVQDTDRLTPWTTFCRDKLIISHVVKQECLHLMETESSLPCLQELVTGP